MAAASAAAESIAPGVVRVTAPNPGLMTGAGTNSYFIGDDALLLVDPGPAIDAHVDALVEYAGGRLQAILVSHTHRDHSPAAALLARRTGAPVYGMRPPPTPENDQAFRPDHVLEHDQRIAIGGHAVTVIHTPGHASNHVCFLHEASGLLFTGDHIMNGSTVVIAAPDGNMRQYLDSLTLLKRYAPRAIAPGHGAVMDDPERVIDWIVAHRLEREAKVVAKLDTHAPCTTDELLAHVYDEVDPQLWPVARYSLVAHLGKLAEDGRARQRNDRWTLIDAG